MKKITVIILVLAISLSLVACGTDKNQSSTEQAYITVAQEQIAADDFESAIKTIEEGIKLTNSDKLKAMHYEVSANLTENQPQEPAVPENNPPVENDPPVKEEVKVETPPPAPTISNEEKKRIARDGFYQKASVIETYAKNNLETAMTQTDINIESGIVAEKWDVLLNEVYKYLKNTMPKSEFNALKADELAWIAEKESAAERAAAEFAGGTGEPMARNSALIEYTRNRCYYLISLV